MKIKSKREIALFLQRRNGLILHKDKYGSDCEDYSCSLCEIERDCNKQFPQWFPIFEISTIQKLKDKYPEEFI